MKHVIEYSIKFWNCRWNRCVYSYGQNFPVYFLYVHLVGNGGPECPVQLRFLLFSWSYIVFTQHRFEQLLKKSCVKYLTKYGLGFSLAPTYTSTQSAGTFIFFFNFLSNVACIEFPSFCVCSFSRNFCQMVTFFSIDIFSKAFERNTFRFWSQHASLQKIVSSSWPIPVISLFMKALEILGISLESTTSQPSFVCILNIVKLCTTSFILQYRSETGQCGTNCKSIV